MKKIIIIILLVAVLAVGGYFLFGRKISNNEITYQYTSLEKGDIESIVSCTGTLEFLGAVEVGTELSGTVTEVLVDYNDDVDENQILAVLDTTKIVYEVRNAQAAFANSEAQYKLAKRKYEDDKKLFAQNFISDLDLLTSETSYKQAYASYVSAEINLEKAQTNLNKYSIIRSPFKGKVIDRSVEEGQTVAASLSAPVLFTIAEDLSQMEIHALVDESDIGLIDEGQKVEFTVAAYTDEEFVGVVRQIRLQPKVISNVVNYTVIISTSNDRGLLLPGMTATIDIVTESVEDVYFLPNAALSYTPPTKVLEDLMRTRAQHSPQGKESSSQGPRQFGRMEPSAEMLEKMAIVWFENEDGEIMMTPVEKGFSDGINTELTQIGRLNSDSKIIIGDNDKTKSSSTTSTTRNQQRGPGGPPMRGLF